MVVLVRNNCKFLAFLETLTKHEEMQTPQERYEKSVQNLPSLEAGVEMPRGEMPSIATLFVRCEFFAIRIFPKAKSVFIQVYDS